MRLLVTIALLAASACSLHAEEPSTSPEELKSSVLKDCRTYRSFCAAKHARIKEALRRGGEAEATQVCERLIAEESRTLKRVIWYLSNDRSQKATRESLEKVLARVESTPPPEALRAAVDSRFALPPWLADPFHYQSGDGDKKDAKPSGGVTLAAATGRIRADLGDSAPRVLAAPVAPVVKPAAPAAPPPAPTPAPPVATPPVAHPSPPAAGGSSGTGCGCETSH